MIDVHITYPAKYQVALKGYFDAIFGPFRPYVLKGIEKIKDLPIDYVCTSHGPVLTPGGLFPQVLAQYTEWAQPVKNDKPQIPIFYCSAYENTQRVAEKLREGVLAVLPEAEVPLYNIIDHDMGPVSYTHLDVYKRQTLVMAIVSGQTLHICHVGDSRIYLVHGGETLQLTKDHSMVQMLSLIHILERHARLAGQEGGRVCCRTRHGQFHCEDGPGPGGRHAFLDHPRRRLPQARLPGDEYRHV